MEVKDELLKGDKLVAQAEIDKDMQAYLHSKPYLQWWDGASFLGYNLWHTHVALLAGRLAALGYRKVTTCEKCNWNGTCCKALTHNGGDVDFCSQGIPKEDPS